MARRTRRAELVGEAQLRAVLDALPARVALIDRRRRHRYVNQQYAEFIGLPAAAILGRTVAQVIGTRAYARIREYGARALAGETVRFEGWLPYRGDPGLRFVQRVYAPYRAGDSTGKEGGIVGYFVFARDLTALKRSEEQLAARVTELAASQALNAAITASALDCIVMVDEEGRVVAFNPAAERTFGYAQAEALGRPISELIVPPAMRAQHVEGFARYLRTGQGTMLGRRVELEAMRADGSTFPVELAITEVRLPDRRLFTAFLRDLTQSRAAAARIEEQRRALHQAEKLAAVASLLSGVAHELNNPLAIVIGHALMLEEEAEEAGAHAVAERAGRLRAASDRCARIVRDYLATARHGGPGPTSPPLPALPDLG